MNYREDLSASGTERDHEACETLRETVGSVLAALGKNWDGVRGMALRLAGIPVRHPSFEIDLGGHVPRKALPAILDLPASEIGYPGWGVDGARGVEGVEFAAAVRLDDAVVVFSPEYRAGEYVGCHVYPTAPGPRHAIEFASADRPPGS